MHTNLNLRFLAGVVGVALLLVGGIGSVHPIARFAEYHLGAFSKKPIGFFSYVPTRQTSFVCHDSGKSVSLLLVSLVLSAALATMSEYVSNLLAIVPGVVSVS